MVPIKHTGPNAFCLVHLWHPPESTSNKLCVSFQLKEKVTLRTRKKKILVRKSLLGKGIQPFSYAKAQSCVPRWCTQRMWVYKDLVVQCVNACTSMKTFQISSSHVKSWHPKACLQPWSEVVHSSLATHTTWRSKLWVKWETMSQEDGEAIGEDISKSNSDFHVCPDGQAHSQVHRHNTRLSLYLFFF